MLEVQKSCNAINCIRVLPVKIHAPVSAFVIERTCRFAKNNSCRVSAEKSIYFTPIPKDTPPDA